MMCQHRLYCTYDRSGDDSLLPAVLGDLGGFGPGGGSGRGGVHRHGCQYDNDRPLSGADCPPLGEEELLSTQQLQLLNSVRGIKLDFITTAPPARKCTLELFIG